jgi:hypothetical protein
LLQHQKETAPVLTAVHMHVVEVNIALLGFAGYFSPEMLSQHSLSCSDFASYDYALSHSSRHFDCVVEVAIKEFELKAAVLEL